MKAVFILASLFAAFFVNAASFQPLDIGCDVESDSIKLVVRNNTSHYVKLKVVSSANNVMTSGSSGNSISSLSLSKSQFPVEVESSVLRTFVINDDCYIDEKNAS
ncbi:hypothetical protein [uncultured Photobacterium sp.]|uniref:hypothetical protein n=1 Tax=uncultured Photobacterium sp. TaxID=173973 RepID=UPI002606087C|nr:hypothetical protein [uncultured Photobacterium sp.]